MAEARQTILKQQPRAVPMVEAKQSILKQELQSELKGALEGRRVPSLPTPDDSSEAGGGAGEEQQQATGTDAQVQTDLCAFRSAFLARAGGTFTVNLASIAKAQGPCTHAQESLLMKVRDYANICHKRHAAAKSGCV